MSIKEIIKNISGASSIGDVKVVQSLWSGYGSIKRYKLEGSDFKSLLVKQIKPPKQHDHPQGWNTDISHQRKLTSYRVEAQWYRKYAQLTKGICRVPQCYELLNYGEELMIIMEDLDATGYDIRKNPDTVELEDALNCLSWLAGFHSRFLGSGTEGLWPIGTYWHLNTRPDEYERMLNTGLKKVAVAIDDKLCSAKYQTIVHGDAKLANFCFAQDGSVAAVDFQYAGGGCGIKDVVYLISSCFDEYLCERYEEHLLDHYFKELKKTLSPEVDFDELQREWCSLYKYAWADFYRFLDGWRPGHWKMHEYSLNLTKQVIGELQNEVRK